MTKQQLINTFNQHHKAMIDFVDGLNETDYSHQVNGKWTAAQQLSHILLCLKPINKAIASKSFIEVKFGHINRPTLDYDQVIHQYQIALAEGGKAPDNFVPQSIVTTDKSSLINDLMAELTTIEQHLEHYTEAELDTLTLPHPLLGKLTVRELFYLMAYHAIHHLEQTKTNLAG